MYLTSCLNSTQAWTDLLNCEHIYSSVNTSTGVWTHPLKGEHIHSSVNISIWIWTQLPGYLCMNTSTWHVNTSACVWTWLKHFNKVKIQCDFFSLNQQHFVVCTLVHKWVKTQVPTYLICGKRAQHSGVAKMRLEGQGLTSINTWAEKVLIISINTRINYCILVN